MEYVKGKYRKSIFQTEDGYIVGLFRVSETSSSLSDVIDIPSTITFTGTFTNLNDIDNYCLYGEYLNHPRYGYQFKVESYEKVELSSEEQVLEFLASPFVKGCGEKTALKIVTGLGPDAIKLIKNDINNLLKLGISEKTSKTIYNSIVSFYDQDELIMYLNNLGLSNKEVNKLLNKYGNKIKDVIDNDLYSLVDIVDFPKLDNIFFKLNEETNDMRILACIIQVLKVKTFEQGDTYLTIDEIIDGLKKLYGIELGDNIEDYINTLLKRREIKYVDNHFYLMSYFEEENYIAKTLFHMSDIQEDEIPRFDTIIKTIEREHNITYNHDQIRAIREAMINQITIVTGGPGTGKTTIIKGILKMYQELFKVSDRDITKHVALLAPTGRAAKRMSESTFMPASTIHRYLKWNKETNEFNVNILNPNEEDLIIIDEVSMIDIDLFASLLKGIVHSAKIVLVGDSNQLPSVGPGNILKDIIDSDMFAHIELTEIYRQSDDSFIPILADEIKKHEITSDILVKRDDYNFIETPSESISSTLYQIINHGLVKGLNEENVQILVPMYKGANGIDAFNDTLEYIFNPNDNTTHKVGNINYKVGDKIINLVNNVDLNIYNGDIGYITWIDPKNKEGIMGVNFYGHEVALKNEDIQSIKHAYAMSIHKAQGSEFDHVILPITKEYSRMLYNKLIYTAVSRAKKSLIIIGDVNAFLYAVKNTYTSVRKTTLKEMILEQFKRIQ